MIFCLFRLLTAVEHGVDFRHVRLVVDDLSIDFDLGVGLERHALCGDDQLRRYSTASEQAGCRGRTRKTLDLFPIPDTCHIDRRTYPFKSAVSCWLDSKGKFANLIVQSPKVSARDQAIELNDHRVSL
jgi:hypothetical protein